VYADRPSAGIRTKTHLCECVSGVCRQAIGKAQQAIDVKPLPAFVSVQDFSKEGFYTWGLVVQQAPVLDMIWQQD